MIIQSKKVWIADQFTPAQLELEDGIIKEIYPYNEKEVTKDYGDLRILPGFIDIHCHGAYGFDTNDANPEGLRKWAKGIVDEGVTSFLATTLTQSEEVLTNAVSNVAKVVEEGYEGAEILGIHFEGPYLNKAHKGAQPEEYCVKPNIEQFKRYQKAAHGLIKYITMAVENDEDYALTKYCSQNNVVVSIGHSNATYEQAVQAYAHGARSMTHVYNAMTPFTHRANGLVGGALRIRNMYGEIICDGNHSTLAALNNFFTSKGPDYSIMITDSLMCIPPRRAHRRSTTRPAAGSDISRGFGTRASQRPRAGQRRRSPPAVPPRLAAVPRRAPRACRARSRPCRRLPRPTRRLPVPPGVSTSMTGPR